MALLWEDGTWSTEARVSGYSYEAPIVGSTTAYIRRCDYIVQASSYSPPAMSAVADTTWRFVGDSPLQDIGGGMVRFTRTWVNCLKATADDPFITHTEYETFAYNFIGYYGAYGVNTTTVTGRDRFTKVVLSQILHQYYLCASGQTYTSGGAIPINAAQTYKYGAIDVDWLADSPPFAAATIPSKTDYASWITDATNNKWSATIGQGRICAQDSTLERWLGEIWVRKTRYVLAQ